ncbi:RELT-like protein 2 isoform X4 [Stegostoma tigrinum]|uniref:RELT-like protein 2 isoform X4 n=1 Tax=Stegostoma tigrinum TaxID=3053191 RepID=UPI00202B6903|nr:RELT-like protein 2 isoform X4 [Stegostoma tigrinum]
MENHGEIEEATAHPQNLYTILLLVLVFFVMGLTGVLLCHILKEKGYHCRTSQEMDTEQEDTTSPEDIQEISKSNQDTVGQIVQCIIENEANVEALNELLREHEQVKPPVPRFRVTRVEKGQWAQELNRLPVIEACSGGHSVTTQTEPDYEKHMTHVSTANEGTEKESDPAQL